MIEPLGFGIGQRVYARLNGELAPGIIRAKFDNTEGHRYYVVELEYYSFERLRIIAPELLQAREHAL